MRGLGLLAIAVSLLACRMDPGEPDYGDLEDVFDRASQDDDDEPVVGPDPYVPGEARLSLGIFYEGGFSDIVPINGQDSNYYIFLADGQLSYTQSSFPERVEGAQSDLLTLAGTSWWGGGIIWEPSRDLSDWTTLAVSLLSNDIEELEVTLGSDVEVSLPATDYGYTNDGEWHHLVIPLADFTAGGVDLSATRLAFVLGGVGGNAGARLLVDNVYLE